MAQAEVGYLPLPVQAEVAELFQLDPNEINAIVTFYDMFFEKPVGKHLIHVCKNVSCMLRGADQVLQQVCQKLQIQPNGMSADGQFTVIASECLGACDRAPMALVDDKVVGPIQAEEIDTILQEALKGPGHPSPTQTMESTNA